jgi:NAD(P)-dependent dehydrogenase (short-subunit alcohol dehydrogenase family)
MPQSKSGLHGFSKALALELASNVAEFSPEPLTQFAKTVPAKRLGTPDDVANFIVYLGSEANSFINGEAIRVTGGNEIRGSLTLRNLLKLIVA